RIFRETGLEQRVELRGQRRIDLGGTWRRLLHHADDDLTEVLSLRDALAEERFVGDTAKGIEIGALVDLVALKLLGSHVGRRPDDRAAQRQLVHRSNRFGETE